MTGQPLIWSPPHPSHGLMRTAKTMVTGKGNKTDVLQDLDKSIQERWMVVDKHKDRGAGQSKTKDLSWVLYCVLKTYQSHFSLVCPMSPDNKSWDLRWPERFLCLSLQPNGLLSQQEEAAPFHSYKVSPNMLPPVGKGKCKEEQGTWRIKDQGSVWLLLRPHSIFPP